MAKRIASINIQKAHLGEFWHNTREKDTVNSIFDKSKNEYDRTAMEAIEIYKKDLEEKSKKYTERTGQKLQKRATTLMNAVVNLDEHHTLNDLKKVAKMLEKKLDVKVYQVVVHRDEGFIGDDGKKHVNFHGHILFSGLDSQGRAVKRNKLNIHTLRELQTETANVLGMERGVRGKKRKHLDIHTYKVMKQEESKALWELKQNVKLDDKKIKKYTKKFDKALERFLSFGRVKKDDVISLFGKFLNYLKTEIVSLEKENEKLRDENLKLKQRLGEKNLENADLKVENQKLREESKQLLEENLKARETIKKVKQLDSVKLAQENKELKMTIKDLQTEISMLRKQMIETNKKLEAKEQEKVFNREDFQYLSKLKKELRKDTVKEVYEELIKYKKEVNKKGKGIDF